MKRSTNLTHRLFGAGLRLRWLLLLPLLLIGSTGLGQAAGPLHQQPPADIVVSTTADAKKANDGFCSLREAIIAANADKRSGNRPGECPAGSGADTIILPAGTYVFSRSNNGKEDSDKTGDLDIWSDLNIVGQGAGQTIIDGSGMANRVFHNLTGVVEISGVTILKNGLFDGDGAAIHNSGVLTLVNSVITGVQAAGDGGAIYNVGVLTLRNSTLGGNTAGGAGGGVANIHDGAVTINNSTVSGNLAETDGGGFFNAGRLTLNSATISFNEAGRNGGGLFNIGGQSAVDIRNTILGGNQALETGPDCFGTLSSLGYNLLQDGGGCQFVNDVSSNLVGDDPLLEETLKENDGQTPTHKLLPGSPAIDGGDPAGCFGSEGLLAFDQRNGIRPMDGDSNSSFLCDIGAFEVQRSALGLVSAFPNDSGPPGSATVRGRFDKKPDATITVSFFNSCQPNDGDLIETVDALTDENGYFVTDISSVTGRFVTARINDPDEGLIQSRCAPFSRPNNIWPNAEELTFNNETPRSALVDNQFITDMGQSRWYRIEIEPNSNLFITLSGQSGPDAPLPADYDLTLYGDLQAAFDEAANPDQDIIRLSAEYAGDSYSGDSYSGDSYSGDSYSGDSYSGDSYSGDSYSGAFYSGDSYSGDSYSGDSYSGDSYSGDSYSGDSYSGDSYSGDSYSGDSYSSDVFGGDSYSEAYSDAQSRSLLAVSAFAGLGPESIFVRTWNGDGFYYLRVRSRNGEFSLADTFRLEVRLEANGCTGVEPLPPGDPLGPAGNPTTLILYDSSRLQFIEGSLENGGQIDLVANLNVLAGAVDGRVIDVNADSRVREANDQADNDHPACPFAKNVVARAIKEIIDGYRTRPGSNLRYVVLVGGDKIIPFFRHSDNADLAPESQFVPPVKNDSPSEAALRLNYVLSQDAYVAEKEVDLTDNRFPIVAANVSIGRLVETATEISAVIDAFLSAPNGVVHPQTALVTGYDFLEDASLAIRDQLAAGLGAAPDELITPFEVPPTDPRAWTAGDLRGTLLAERHDLIFLAGHFSGHSALAADYTSEIFAAEVKNSAVDLKNSIIFSVGCHSGYNIVNQDEVPGIPRDPDWAQAFAGKGATLVGGTGYQYGETLTQEYSERLYIEFSKQLRIDTGAPIAIGRALNAAKLAYLTQVPQIRGLHEKVLLQATIFGLPMLRVDLPGRFTPASDSSIITAPLAGFETEPGLTTGLQYTDIEVMSPVNDPAHRQTVTLTDITDPAQPRDLTAEFLTGSDGGIVTNPTEPFLPLEVRNVTVPDTTLRGVGFRGGTYTDIFNILPVTGAPTTEAVALHLSWQTDYLHPIQMWNSNYLGALIDGQQRLLVTPAQHIAGDIQDGVRQSDRRQFSEMNFRLFYSDNFQDFNGHIPALSSPPSIIRVATMPGDDEIVFRVTAVGDPSAGMQAVWIVWTDTSGPCPCTWQSLDLTQRETDTTMWEGVLPLAGGEAQNIRFMAQAVNGFGRLAWAANGGQFFTPGVDTAPTEETVLTLDAANPTAGLFAEQATFRAFLTTPAGEPLADRTVRFRLGPILNAMARTDSSGQASVTLNLLSSPAQMQLYAIFDGTEVYKSSSATAGFSLEPQQPALQDLTDTSILSGQDSGVVVTLVDQTDDPMRERSVFIVVTAPDDPATPLHSVAGITDLFGRVSLGPVPLPPGEYLMTVYFNDPANPLAGSTTDAYKSVQASANLTIMGPVEPTATPTQTPTAPPVPILPVRPVLECVTDHGDDDDDDDDGDQDDDRYTAFFGYLNENESSLTVPVGSSNNFSPAPPDRGQPTEFEPGRRVSVFAVDFDGENLVWSLQGSTSTASSNSHRCESPTDTVVPPTEEPASPPVPPTDEPSGTPGPPTGEATDPAAPPDAPAETPTPESPASPTVEIESEE